MTDEKQTIDSLLENFDINQIEDPELADRKMLSIWIPDEYKEKYNHLQKASSRQFGKVLRQIILKSIDRVKV